MIAYVRVDKDLLAEAQQLGGHRSKQAALRAALHEYIRRCKQQQLPSVFGTVKYDSAYDYKRERAKRS